SGRKLDLNRLQQGAKLVPRFVLSAALRKTRGRRPSSSKNASLSQYPKENFVFSLLHYGSESCFPARICRRTALLLDQSSSCSSSCSCSGSYKFTEREVVIW